MEVGAHGSDSTNTGAAQQHTNNLQHHHTQSHSHSGNVSGGPVVYPYPQYQYFNTVDPEQYLGMMQHLRYMENFMPQAPLKDSLEEGMGTPPSKKRRTQLTYPVSHSSTLFPNHALYSNSPTGRFMLVEQPNVRQRKSYKNENRYNPLIQTHPTDICSLTP